MPVILEQGVNTLNVIVLAAIVGTVSGTALASNGVINSVLNLLLGVFSILTMGCSLLVARLVGAGSVGETSRTVEQGLLMTLTTSLLCALLIFAAADPLTRLLTPNADETFIRETRTFLRIVTFSIPLYVLYTVLNGILRAAGRSRAVFVATAVTCAAQIAFSALFVFVFHWGLAGAGLGLICCRIAGLAVILINLREEHTYFRLDPRRIFRPEWKLWKRIARVGFPLLPNGVCVQGAYLIANTMTIGLGTFQASAYQVANSLHQFPMLPWQISSAVTLTLVGQALGAGDRRYARRIANYALILTPSISCAIMLVIALFGRYTTRLFTSDPAVSEAAIPLLWHLLFTSLVGGVINGIDHVLCAGGMSRFVMSYTIIGVIALRLPLTWLFCYRLNTGVAGVILANNVNLLFRCIVGLWANLRGKWLYRNL